MIGDVKGYCVLKSLEHCFIGHDKDADPEGYEDIQRLCLNYTPLCIIDIAVDGDGLMCIEPKGRAIVMVNSMADVASWFECREVSGVVVPKTDDTAMLMAEVTKRILRKGGYNDILRRMVILNSIRTGKFNDDFLFSKE